LAQSWHGNRPVKLIFGMTKTWNAPWGEGVWPNQHVTFIVSK